MYFFTYIDSIEVTVVGLKGIKFISANRYVRIKSTRSLVNAFQILSDLIVIHLIAFQMLPRSIL